MDYERMTTPEYIANPQQPPHHRGNTYGSGYNRPWFGPVVDAGIRRGQCRHDLRDLAGRKLHINHGPHHLNDLAACHTDFLLPRIETALPCGE